MIYVIRHGQTDWNIIGKTQGSIDTELNETGIIQAKSIKNELLNTKLDVVLCSPRNRCKSTAKIICSDRHIPIVEVEIVTHSGVCAMIYCYFNNMKPNGRLKIPGIKNCELVKYNTN